STPQDAYSLLRAAIASPDPVVFLEPKKLYWSKGPVDTSITAEIGRARIAREGTDVTVLAYAAMVPVALEAAEIAASEGRSVQVIDGRCLSPFDDAHVAAAVRATGRAVVVAESPGYVSVASEIQARVFERCFEYLEAPVRRVTGFDTPFAPPKLEHWYLPDADRILDAIDSLHWDDEQSDGDSEGAES